MFTGLVEGLGTVARTLRENAGVRLEIVPLVALEPGVRIGDSVAINGCCLTLVQFEPGLWVFQAGPETLAKTNLGRLQPGDQVNLERPLAVNGRLGGHFVQGHVDGLGQIDTIERQGEWVTIRFRVPEQLAGQMVAKGSVAVDGVSLTVVEVTSNGFSVALIPHTLEVTTLGQRQPGESVNIETDILAKYVEKLVQQR